MVDRLVNHAYLIPVFPFLAFWVIALFSRRLKLYSAWISIGAVIISLIFSLAVLWMKIQPLGIERVLSWSWKFLTVGKTVYPIGVQIDNLSTVMLIVVTLVGSCIQIYSVGYMAGDEGFPRYFGFLSLFTASMLGLVLADNFLLLYICWELVGFTSYALIGFWFRKPSAAKAGKKAFLTTRTGDIGFLLGWLTLFGFTGSFALNDARMFIVNHPDMAFLWTVVALLIFWGAVGKSAQIPLHVWLPDAMEGPTPVSALIHAATMVAAGVYLVARTYFLFASAPQALLVVAYIGALTAFFAATIGMAMHDIKRVLAYSTISQLGYMMAGLGVGGYTAGVFHLFTHAFFKALLFLGAGSVIHACHTNDMRRMGGLARILPITHWTFVFGALALIGIPPFAGFFSKDEILASAFLYSKEHGHWLIFLLLLVGVFFTSFYMFRALYLTFWSKARYSHHPHESPRVMTIPLIILAFFSLTAGFLYKAFGEFLFVMYPIPSEESPNWLVMGLSMGMALLGFYLAYQIYGIGAWDKYLLRKRYPLVERTLRKKYFVDEIYETLIITPGLHLSYVARGFDKWVIDGMVNLTGYLGVGWSFFTGFFDKTIVDGFYNLLAWITGQVASASRRLQTGNVSNYFLTMLASLALMLILLKFLFKGG